MDKQLLETTVSKVLNALRDRPIPLGVSNRHIHLSAEDYARLFPGHPISEKKGLLQPGQYAAEQTVTLAGPKGQLKMSACWGRCAAPARWRFRARMPGRWASPHRCECPVISTVRRGFAW